MGLQGQGVPAERAEIIAAEGNFHGRTIAIVGFCPCRNTALTLVRSPLFHACAFWRRRRARGRHHPLHSRIPDRADPG